ncbi:hypothetical protein NDJ66_24270 [Escherichia coli]|uniref:hypothetical protein n=1 Tax=Escherichia coli TaxID=562 RepID=UPI0020C75619|nr:hypothetical protein [Escherichia coli]MCP8773620.1 hypothetical protein [Escherichia coli]
MSFKLLQHRPQVGAFLEQQLPVQLENVLQVAAEYAPLTNWLHMAYQVIPISQ